MMTESTATASLERPTPVSPKAPNVTDRFGLLIPDGVGVRNFVLGPFLTQACREAEIHAIHAIPPEALRACESAYEGDVKWHELVPFPDRPLSFVLRHCLNVAQMWWVDTFPMRLVRSRKVNGSWKAKAAMKAAQMVGYMSATPRGILRLDRLHAWAASSSPEVKHYQKLLKEINPSVLFCSHQRPSDIIPPVLAARSLGIPTATFIFSWDNLTSKGRIAAPFDHFLVWSDLMRQELLRYYPDVTEDRVHIVGTPQFDTYADDSLLWTREEFFRRIGADPARKLICYSGGDVSNSPEDPQHVRALLAHIKEGRIKENAQVIVRPSPVDDGKRYAEVRRDYPDLLYAQPAWVHEQVGNWAKVIPRPEDVRFLVNLTKHADMNVNFGSTMTLDFALRDKPVVNVAFDVSNPPVYGMPMWDYLKSFDHYLPVIELGAARFARTEQDLADHVNAFLADPSLDREKRKKFVDLEVGVPVGQAGDKILETMHRIARK